MPYLADMAKSVALHEWVATLSLATLSILSNDRSQSPAAPTESGIGAHPPPSCGEGSIGCGLLPWSPADSLSSSHVGTQLGSTIDSSGMATGRNRTFLSKVPEVFVLSALASRKPISLPSTSLVSSCKSTNYKPSLYRKRPYWGGPFQWLQFCGKFQLPFLELLFGHFRIQNKNINSTWTSVMDDVPAGFLADAHVAPPSPHRAMLWYAAECGQRHLSLAKFMRLGPLESDSYCDSDDKTQPVQLLVKQRSGSQSVDRLAEAPQSFEWFKNIAIIRTLSSPGPITKANPTETTITRRNANRSPRQTSGWHGRA